MSHEAAPFEVRRILVCQQRQIGDVLLATPALELLKKRFPDAELALFTEEKCAPLLRGNPHIDTFLLPDKKASFFTQIRWYRKVTAGKWDLAVDFQQLPRCRMMVRFSQARIRLSFSSPWYRPFLYTHTLPLQTGYAAASKVSLLAPLGITWHGERPRIYLTEEERASARRLLTELGLQPGQRLVCVDSTHRRSTKRWPWYAQLIDRLAEARPELRFLLLRGPGEDEEVRALAQACHMPERIFLPEPLPDLRTSAACMAEAALHVGNCSAPRHMAAALGIPSLVIPGASGPEWTCPEPRHVELRPELPCNPCSRIECSDLRCLTQVTPEAATSAALRLLETDFSKCL